MTVQLPLCVRLRTKRSDVDVSYQVADLSYRVSIPGGYATASISLSRPLDIQPEEIEYFGTLFVYDGRNGRTLWEGRIEDLGRAVTDLGETWNITATGPMAHAQDRVFPVIYIDQSQEGWRRSRYSVSKAITEQGEITEEEPALMVRANEGDAIDTTWAGDWIYRNIAYCGQLIGRVRADVVSDANSSSYKTGLFTRLNAGGAVWSSVQNYSTTPQVVGGYPGSPAWDTNVNVASFRAQRDVSSTTADAFTTTYFYNFVVRAILKNTDGTDNFTAADYAVNNVDPNEVVKDLLGRVLTQFDGPGATVVGSGVDIDQLAYPDGTTAADILDDLALYDPGFYWAAWESNLAGKNRFEYVPWPTTVRYEATSEDGFDSPASAANVYNAVRVRWRDVRGQVRNMRRTQVIQDLTDAGLTREGYIDLSDEIGSILNATYVADNFLAEHRYPPNSGVLKVGRKILDNNTGRMVDPWEILPGHLIRVRGILPRVDALNPTNRDGVTVFRVISMDFTVSEGQATLELDSYARTIGRLLAENRKIVRKSPGQGWHSGGRLRKR